MELPFTIVFEPPGRSELRALLRMRGHWADRINRRTDNRGHVPGSQRCACRCAERPQALCSLHVTSTPSGATLSVDGRRQESRRALSTWTGGP